VAAIRRLERHGHEHDWIGPDPYEGLNATRFVGPLKRTPTGRRVLHQVVKRSPLDLRPLLGIEPTPNSSTAAWAVSAYARGGFMDGAEELRLLELALERLLALRSPQFEHSAWGYQFPTQSRVFFYDRLAPSTVATCFAGQALLDAHERTGDELSLDVARDTAAFITSHLAQTADAPGAFFGYLVGDRSPIHNSNLHACAFLARLASVTGDEELRSRAELGVRWTLARQRPDGSWPYGERANLGWVDGFHTGYVLDSLRACADAGIELGIEEAWLRGLAYWRERLFLADGTPKYYADAVYPIDSQCVAQAIQTFAVASAHDASCLDAAWKVFDWALANMRGDDGLFYFQRRRFWVNRTPHMRWAETCMLLALVHLLHAARGRSRLARLSRAEVRS
jgi:rhamnogalacturonyl hydrolase YesR